MGIYTLAADKWVDKR